MKRTALILAVGLLAVLVAIGYSIAGNNRNFAVHLTGDQEVPPNDSKAQGQAIFQVSPDGNSIDFKVIVANIENVRASHIHLGAPGVAGPIVVPLYTGPVLPGRVDGTLAEGTFTAADITGPLAGQSISALVDSMNAGVLYVNVHTDQHLSGEIRGQFK